MPTPVQGELVRHHNKPFYAQQSAPKFFWAGCLIPIFIIGVIGFLIIQGASTTAGEGLIRGFILFVIGYMVLQLLFGGGLFIKNKSSLARGLLFGGAGLLILLLVALIGAASIIGQFIQ